MVRCMEDCWTSNLKASATWFGRLDRLMTGPPQYHSMHAGDAECLSLGDQAEETEKGGGRGRVVGWPRVAFHNRVVRFVQERLAVLYDVHGARSGSAGWLAGR